MENIQINYGVLACGLIVGMVVCSLILFWPSKKKKTPKFPPPSKPYVDWGKEYSRYFWKGGKGLVHYETYAGTTEVLRIPLKNPYDPYSDEWVMYENMFDEVSEDKPYLEWMAEHKRAMDIVHERDRIKNLRYETRLKVVQRIRVQHRRVARCA